MTSVQEQLAIYRAKKAAACQIEKSGSKFDLMGNVSNLTKRNQPSHSMESEATKLHDEERLTKVKF